MKKAILGRNKKLYIFLAPNLLGLKAAIMLCCLPSFNPYHPEANESGNLYVACRNRLCPLPIFKSAAKVPLRLTFQTLLCPEIKPKLSYSNHLILI
jgi:hypothetical protein